MTADERKKKLGTLPWQALHDLAIEKEIDEAEVNGKDKETIIERILSVGAVNDTEIEALVNDYIYGNRVTFTIWRFSSTLSKADYDALEQLQGKDEYELGSFRFRGLRFLSVESLPDRIEILYVYSKEYVYFDEEGRSASIWEQHRGCMWIGKGISYVACISKHDRMTTCVVNYITELLGNKLVQITPPKSAIEKCAKYKARSRIVLQGTDGEKTIISRSGGLTEDQESELAQIRGSKMDTAGSYIAETGDDISATVKYTIKKGSIGILKHLPTEVLFDWSQNAIQIILDEIDKLKGKPAEEIFDELGLELRWPGLLEREAEEANCFLTHFLSAMNTTGEYIMQLEEKDLPLLKNQSLFVSYPRVFCNTCGTYELPHCESCGAPLKMNSLGALACSCGAPLRVCCPEGHFAEIEYWYLPTPRFKKAVKATPHNGCIRHT